MIEKRQRRRRDGQAYTVWRVRYYDGVSERSKTFDRAGDARAFEAKIRTLKRSGALAELDAGQETLRDFAQEWWKTYATTNLQRSTLETYACMWNRHALPRLGDYQLRELSPRLIANFRTELETDEVGPEAIRKTMAMLQGILQRAVEWERMRSNPAKVVRKPPAQRQRAIQPLPPERIEALRAVLVAEDRYRDAALVSVLAYAGLRPQEALALTWRHVRERTLLVEQALANGELKGQKTGKPPRTVVLLAPLRQDLTDWRHRHGNPRPEAYLFPNEHGEPWKEHDWRNWRRRIYAPAAEIIGIDSARPYDLRHSFASLLIHEGRYSIVEIAAQLGHNPNVCLSTYAHVMAELAEHRGTSAEEQIRAAREAATSTGAEATGDTVEMEAESDPVDLYGPNTAQEPDDPSSATSESADLQEALHRTRTGDPFLTINTRRLSVCFAGLRNLERSATHAAAA